MIIEECQFSDLPSKNLQNNLIILDIDGTIAPEGLNQLEPSVFETINKLTKNNSLVLCSNSFKRQRNQQFSKVLNLTYIDTSIKKPSKRLLKHLPNPDQKPFIVIGDKILTDGLFAWRIKARFIKVKRLSALDSPKTDRIISFIDDLVYKTLQKLHILKSMSESFFI